MGPLFFFSSLTRPLIRSYSDDIFSGVRPIFRFSTKTKNVNLLPPEVPLKGISFSDSVDYLSSKNHPFIDTINQNNFSHQAVALLFQATSSNQDGYFFYQHLRWHGHFLNREFCIFLFLIKGGKIEQEEVIFAKNAFEEVCICSKPSSLFEKPILLEEKLKDLSPIPRETFKQMIRFITPSPQDFIKFSGEPLINCKLTSKDGFKTEYDKAANYLSSTPLNCYFFRQSSLQGAVVLVIKDKTGTVDQHRLNLIQLQGSNQVFLLHYYKGINVPTMKIVNDFLTKDTVHLNSSKNASYDESVNFLASKNFPLVESLNGVILSPTTIQSLFNFQDSSVYFFYLTLNSLSNNQIFLFTNDYPAKKVDFSKDVFGRISMHIDSKPFEEDLKFFHPLNKTMLEAFLHEQPKNLPVSVEKITPSELGVPYFDVIYSVASCSKETFASLFCHKFQENDYCFIHDDQNQTFLVIGRKINDASSETEITVYLEFSKVVSFFSTPKTKFICMNMGEKNINKQKIYPLSDVLRGLQPVKELKNELDNLTFIYFSSLCSRVEEVEATYQKALKLANFTNNFESQMPAETYYFSTVNKDIHSFDCILVLKDKEGRVNRIKCEIVVHAENDDLYLLWYRQEPDRIRQVFISFEEMLHGYNPL